MSQNKFPVKHEIFLLYAVITREQFTSAVSLIDDENLVKIVA
jgi:hypothetical protein